jgi:hypothetical protein
MNYSGSELIVLLVAGLVFGFVGYRLSENFRKVRGRTPWGMPSALWGFIWFLSLALGLVLYLIARATTKVDGVGRPGSGRYGDSWPQSPAQPYPPTTPPPAQPYSTGPPVTASTLSPPMWHPDPSGRFDYRWWDGQGWTTRVARGGTQLDDGNPDQRLGPAGPPGQV